MNKYTTPDNVRCYIDLPERVFGSIPKLSDPPIDAEMTAKAAAIVAQNEKIDKLLIIPASAWINSVYRGTAPFPSISEGEKDTDDDALYIFVERRGDDIELNSSERGIIVDVDGIVKDGLTNTRIFDSEDDLSDYTNNAERESILLVGTPPLIEQAATEKAMALAMSIFHRQTEDDVIREWRKQAETTLGVKDAYATVRPHPLIPHNIGSVRLRGRAGGLRITQRVNINL